MPEVHAKLSPSSGERWINCTKSFDLIESLGLPEPKAGFAAEEGTLAHSVLENEARYRLGWDGPTRYKGQKDELIRESRRITGRNSYKEMQEYAQQHLDLIFHLTRREFLKKEYEGLVWLETRVFPGIKGCFGTADTIVALDDELHVIDYKYGRGVPVSPVENSQLKLYGLGAYEALKMFWEFKTVTLHIVQPRINNVTDWETPLEDLLSWREDAVRPAVDSINNHTGVFAPSEKACMWCPAKVFCSARAQSVWEDVKIK